MTYRGRIKNGVIELDTPGDLPEDAQVNVELVIDQVLSSENGLARMLDFVGDAGISDLSTNLDHYLYGHPQVNDAE